MSRKNEMKKLAHELGLTYKAYNESLLKRIFRPTVKSNLIEGVYNNKSVSIYDYQTITNYGVRAEDPIKTTYINGKYYSRHLKPSIIKEILDGAPNVEFFISTSRFNYRLFFILELFSFFCSYIAYFFLVDYFDKILIVVLSFVLFFSLSGVSYILGEIASHKTPIRKTKTGLSEEEFVDLMKANLLDQNEDKTDN